MISFNRESSFYFIGIGGIGMSGLARILYDQGYKVQGSDIKASDITKKLEKIGITVYIGHNKRNISNDINYVIYSAAINEENEEFNESLKRNIPLYSRAELLGSITKLKKNIAVTGTHGKTTTSSILSKILFDASLDPLIILGGMVPFLNSNSYSGKGDFAIYEACEAYGSLNHYSPDYCIIANLDYDHMDYFDSIEHLKSEIRKFILKVSVNGMICLNADDKNLMSCIDNDLKRNYSYYSLENRDDCFNVKDLMYTESGTFFRIFNRTVELCDIKSPLFGIHNVYNFLSAFTMAYNLGIDVDIIKSSILSFQNSQRRLQLIGQYRDIDFYNDYAHHPKEIEVTLNALKQINKAKEITVIFQPHLYSRTQYFYKEFAKSLLIADKIILLPIYPAREKEIKGVNSKMIFDEILSINSKKEIYNLRLEVFYEKHSRFFSKNSSVIFLGAGDINQIASEIVDSL